MDALFNCVPAGSTFSGTPYGLLSSWPSLPRPPLLPIPGVPASLPIVVLAGIAAFDCILFPVCIREMLRPGGNRAIAAAQSLMEVIILLGVLGYSVTFHSGPSRWISSSSAPTLLDMAIAAMLSGGHGRHRKRAARLRAEFEAAREVPSVNWSPLPRHPRLPHRSRIQTSRSSGRRLLSCPARRERGRAGGGWRCGRERSSCSYDRLRYRGVTAHAPNAHCYRDSSRA